MSDLREWLRGNNLEQYAAAFEANDIDLDILPDLDDHDLEQLGLSIGNRRRLLKAIAVRNTKAVPISSADKASLLDKSSSAAPLSSDEKSSAAEELGSADAERRQVTVMFADMVGSTALSAKLDPELLGSLVLASLRMSRPFASWFAGEIYPLPEQIRESATFSGAMRTITVVWGSYFLARALVRLTALLTLSTDRYVLVAALSDAPFLIALLAWSVYHTAGVLRRSAEWGPTIAAVEAAQRS